jgi:hypothetical protein
MGMDSEFTDRGFGWRKNPPDQGDTRFRFQNHAHRLGADITLPPRTDNWSLVPPRRDQGAQSSCSGFAWAGIVGFIRRVDRFKRDTIYSPRDAYWHGRLLEGPEWVKIDAGAYPRFGAKALQDHGIAPESKCAYLPHTATRAPPASAADDRARWKAGPYYHCYSLLEIKAALAAKRPVGFGFACHENMFTAEVDATGRIPMPAGRVVGWHMVYASDYDDDEEVVAFPNSWSERWGDNGFGYMPYDFISNPHLASDFIVITAESEETAKG